MVFVCVWFLILRPDLSQRVEVRPRMACPISVVVAIDFGTTSSGYAFSFTHDSEAIHMMKYESSTSPNTTFSTIPTHESCFDPSVQALGGW